MQCITTPCAHILWSILCAHGVVIHKSSNPAENIRKQLRTLENIKNHLISSWEQLRTRHRYFSSVWRGLQQSDRKGVWFGPVGLSQTRSFLDHLTVMTTFNSSQIFEIHPSTSMLKFLLTPWLLLPLFHLSQISIKSESNFQIFHSDKIVFLGNGGKFLWCSYQIRIDP